MAGWLKISDENKKYFLSGENILLSVFGILLVAGLFIFAQSYSYQMYKSRFNTDAVIRVHVVQDKILQYLGEIETLKRFFGASELVSREEFREFTEGILRTNPGISALVWVPRIRADQRGGFEAMARNEGYPQFAIREPNAKGVLVPAESRQEYYPVYYIEPFFKHKDILGLDEGFEEVRLQTLFRARDNMMPVVTSSIKLVNVAEPAYGFLVFVPVYRHGAVLHTNAQRNGSLQGFVVGVLRVNVLFSEILRLFPAKGLMTSMYDLSDPSHPEELYSAGGRLRPNKLERFLSFFAGKPERLSRDFFFGGRLWRVTVWATLPYFFRNQSFLAYGVPLVAMVFVIFMNLYINAILRQRRRMEAALAESERSYRSIFENTQIAIFRTGIKDGALLRCNDHMAHLLGYSDSADILASGFFASQAYLNPASREQFIQFLTNGRVEKLETVFKKRTGEPIIVLISARKYPDQGYIEGVILDITEQKKAEKLLRNLNRRLQDIIDFLPDATLIVDNEGKVIAWNRALEEMTGVPKNDILGKDHCIGAMSFYGSEKPFLLDFLNNPDSMIDARYVDVIRRGQVLEADVYTPNLYNGKGAYIWAIACPLLDASGNIVGAIESIRDISAQKTAELQREQAMLEVQDLYDHAPCGYHSLDERGIFTRINETELSWLGYPREELIGKKHFEELVTPEFVEVFVRNFAVLKERGVLQDLELELVRKDNSVFNVLFSATAFNDREGNFIRARAVIYDITDRKQVEKALYETTQELDRFFSVSLDLMAIADTDGYFHKLNVQWEKLLGYSLRELEKARFLDYVHPDDVESTLGAVAELRAQNEVVNFVNRYKCKDGTYRWLEWRSFPQGRMIYAAARDITERKKIEDALFQEKYKAQKYLDTAGVMVVIIGRDKRVSLINHRGCEILRCTPQDVIGKNWFEHFVPLRIRGEVNEVFDKIMSGGQELMEHFENPVITLAGQERWISWHNTVLMDSAGNVSEILSSGEDITERRKTELQLRQLSRAIEQSPAITVITALDGTIEYANPKFTEITGFSLDEAIGKNPRILSSGRMDKAFYQGLWSTLLQGGVWKGEFLNKKKDGELYWEDASISPLKDQNGNIIHFVKVSEDVTARKKVEAALIDSEEKYRAIFENATEGIFQTTPSGRYININPAFARMFGFSSPAEMKESVLDIGMELYVNPGDRQRLKKIVETEGKASNFEVEVYKKDKSRFWISINMHAVRDSSGMTLYYEGTNIDITQRRIDESEKERLLVELQNINKEMESIIYVASHDLRSPLVNMQGFSQNLSSSCRDLFLLFQQPEVPDEFKRSVAPIIEEKIPTALHFIQASGSKMDMLISGLLRLSRTGRVDLHSERLNMNVMIDQILSAMAFQIQRTNIAVRVEELPACFGDEFQINQVFSNLIDNAIKYRDPERPLEITVSAAETGGRVVYEVRDTGKGIPAEYQSKVWDLFTRLDPRGPIPGEGLGLTLARRIIERHKGRIWLESELGKGSVFYVELPARESVLV